MLLERWQSKTESSLCLFYLMATGSRLNSFEYALRAVIIFLQLRLLCLNEGAYLFNHVTLDWTIYSYSDEVTTLLTEVIIDKTDITINITQIA